MEEKVKFVFTDNDEQKTANIDAAVVAFGLTYDRAISMFDNEHSILCTPAQFAKFLIYRSANVKINRFVCLNAEIIPVAVEEIKIIVDVSHNKILEKPDSYSEYDGTDVTSKFYDAFYSKNR